jgi:hypothetical protein
MFYYFKDKHKLLEGKLEFKEYNYKFNSSEMELYSVPIPLLICDVKYLTYLVTRSFGNVSCKIFFSCKYIPLSRGNK